jgi:hypothetical protein
VTEENSLEWAGRQPAWARDALRRHAVSGNPSLSEADKAEILACVRHHAGFVADPPPSFDLLTAEHLGAVNGSASRALLCSLGPVQNINRLAGDQQLRFALDGLTVIFGKKGSGKSGYARIAKKLCRSLASTDLPRNVFEAGAKPPAEVKVRYRKDGENQVTETVWTNGAAPPPEISRISVFDTQNARLYVDQENRISFLPGNIALLQRHSEHCAEMDTAFQQELAAVEKRAKVPLPGGYTLGGDMATLLARLDPKSKQAPATGDEVRAATQWTDADVAELHRLATALAHDPAVLAARCRRAKAAIESLFGAVATIDDALSADAASKLEALKTQHRFAPRSRFSCCIGTVRAGTYGRRRPFGLAPHVR